MARQNSMDCILNVTWLIYSHKWRVTIQLRPNMDSTRYKSPGLTYLLTYWCSIIDYHQGGVLELIQY